MNYISYATDKKGFTLIELSIVIVILGLIVGGIMAGTSLIRASELRSVTAEFARYTTALNTFRDKYFALPGDMSNATSYWSGEANGNGDAQIMGSAPTVAATNETGHFWSQLALSTLIEGTYTPGSWAATSTTTNPQSKVSGAFWHMRYVGTVGNDDTVYAAETLYNNAYGNAFFLISGTSLAVPSATGVMKAEEAWGIDTKLDDGKPMTGSIVALEKQGAATPNGCGNAVANTGATAATDYDLVNTSATACSLVFISGL